MWKKSWRRLRVYFSGRWGVYPRPLWIRIPRWLLIHWRYSLIAILIVVAVLIGILFSSSLTIGNLVPLLFFILPVFSFVIYLLMFIVSSPYAKEDTVSPSSIIASAHQDQEKEHLAKARRGIVEKQQLSGITLRYTMRGHKYLVNSIAWSPDGKKLALGSNDWSIHVWDVDAERVMRVLESQTEVYSVTWSPASDLLACGSKDGTIHIWNIESGQLLHTLRQHSGAVHCVAWSPDGRIVASSSSTIQIQSPNTGQTLWIDIEARFGI